MKQEFLLFADGAESVNGKIYILGGGTDRHFVPRGATPPIQLRGDIAVGILVGWHDTNNRHAMTIRIRDEDAVEHVRADVEFETGRPPGAKPSQDFRTLVAIKGPFPLPKPGGYKIEMELDGHVQDPPFRFWIDEADLPRAQRVR